MDDLPPGLGRVEMDVVADSGDGDELRRAQDQVQKLTDKYIATAEQVSAQKEKEVMEI